MAITALRFRKYVIGAVLAGLSLFLAISQPVSAQVPTPSDDAVNAIAREMYCPVCENITLDVCSTQACAQWRQVIREKLGQGWTKAQIEDYFATQYGDRVLAEPPARGVNWLFYLVLAALLVVIIYAAVHILRSWQKAPVRSVPPVAKPDDTQDAYIRRMEEEINRRIGS